MNKTLNNTKNVCITIISLSVINALNYLMQVIHLTNQALDIKYLNFDSIISIVSILYYLLHLTSFIILTILIFLCFINKINRALEDKLIKSFTFVLLASFFLYNTFSKLNVSIYSSILSIILLIFFIILFFKIKQKPSKKQLILLLIILSAIIIDSIYSIYNIINSINNPLFSIYYSGNYQFFQYLIVSTIKNIFVLIYTWVFAICYFYKKLNNYLLIVLTGILIFAETYMLIISYSSIITIILGILTYVPLLLYLLFYNKINEFSQINNPYAIEEKLYTLQAQFDNGEVSFDEYQKERESIINML